MWRLQYAVISTPYFSPPWRIQKKLVLFDISSAIMEIEMKLMEMQGGVS